MIALSGLNERHAGGRVMCLSRRAAYFAEVRSIVKVARSEATIAESVNEPIVAN